MQLAQRGVFPFSRWFIIHFCLVHVIYFLSYNFFSSLRKEAMKGERGKTPFFSIEDFQKKMISLETKLATCSQNFIKVKEIKEQTENHQQTKI